MNRLSKMCEIAHCTNPTDWNLEHEIISGKPPKKEIYRTAFCNYHFRIAEIQLLSTTENINSLGKDVKSTCILKRVKRKK
jgi:hypothetical protein